MVLVFQVIDFNCVLTHSFHSVSVLGGCTDGRKCIYDSYTLTGFLISNHFFLHNQQTKHVYITLHMDKCIYIYIYTHIFLCSILLILFLVCYPYRVRLWLAVKLCLLFICVQWWLLPWIRQSTSQQYVQQRPWCMLLPWRDAVKRLCVLAELMQSYQL